MGKPTTDGSLASQEESEDRASFLDLLFDPESICQSNPNRKPSLEESCKNFLAVIDNNERRFAGKQNANMRKAQVKSLKEIAGKLIKLLRFSRISIVNNIFSEIQGIEEKCVQNEFSFKKDIPRKKIRENPYTFISFANNAKELKTKIEQFKDLTLTRGDHEPIFVALLLMNIVSFVDFVKNRDNLYHNKNYHYVLSVAGVKTHKHFNFDNVSAFFLKHIQHVEEESDKIILQELYDLFKIQCGPDEDVEVLDFPDATEESQVESGASSDSEEDLRNYATSTLPPEAFVRFSLKREAHPAGDTEMGTRVSASLSSIDAEKHGSTEHTMKRLSILAKPAPVYKDLDEYLAERGEVLRRQGGDVVDRHLDNIPPCSEVNNPRATLALLYSVNAEVFGELTNKDCWKTWPFFNGGETYRLDERLLVDSAYSVTRYARVPHHVKQMLTLLDYMKATEENKKYYLDDVKVFCYDATGIYSFDTVMNEWQCIANDAANQNHLSRDGKAQVFYQNNSDLYGSNIAKTFCMQVKQSIENKAEWECRSTFTRNLDVYLGTGQVRKMKVPSYIRTIHDIILNAERSNINWKEAAEKIIEVTSPQHGQKDIDEVMNLVWHHRRREYFPRYDHYREACNSLRDVVNDRNYPTPRPSGSACIPNNIRKLTSKIRALLDGPKEPEIKNTPRHVYFEAKKMMRELMEQDYCKSASQAAKSSLVSDAPTMRV